MHLGYKLRRVRELNKLSPEYVAQEAKFSLRTLQRIEAGRSPITEKRMQNLSKILEATPEDIRAFDEKSVSITTLNAKRDGVAVYNSKTAAEEKDPRDLLIDTLMKQGKLYEDKIVLLEDKITALEKRIREIEN